MFLLNKFACGQSAYVIRCIRIIVFSSRSSSLSNSYCITIQHECQDLYIPPLSEFESRTNDLVAFHKFLYLFFCISESFSFFCVTNHFLSARIFLFHTLVYVCIFLPYTIVGLSGDRMYDGYNRKIMDCRYRVMVFTQYQQPFFCMVVLKCQFLYLLRDWATL